MRSRRSLTVFCCLILAHLFLVLAPFALLLPYLFTHVLGVLFKLLPVGILQLRVRIHRSLPAAIFGILQFLCSIPRTYTLRPTIAGTRSGAYTRDVGRLANRSKRIVSVSSHAACVWLVVRIEDDPGGTSRGW